MTDIAFTLAAKGFSGWHMDGDGYETLVWDAAEAGREKPSLAEIEAWYAEVPRVRAVTPLQARLALRAANLLDTVEAELAKPENHVAQMAWEYATVVERDSPLIATIGGALGMTEQQIDDLFEAAAGL